MHSRRSQIGAGAFALAALGILVLLAGMATQAPGQRMIVTPKHPNLEHGKAVWNNGCIACHGADGKGALETSTVFTRPDTWPDMTRFDQTTPEPDSAYKAVILHGGRGLGFSQIMPAFGDLLTNEQIDDVIAYLRTFCKNDHSVSRRTASPALSATRSKKRAWAPKPPSTGMSSSPRPSSKTNAPNMAPTTATTATRL